MGKAVNLVSDQQGRAPFYLHRKKPAASNRWTAAKRPFWKDFLCLWKGSEWQFSVLIHKLKIVSNIMSVLMRTEHLCAKELELFSHYDILFGRLYPQTISEQSQQRMKKNLDNETPNHHTKRKHTLSFSRSNWVCMSMCVYGGVGDLQTQDPWPTGPYLSRSVIDSGFSLRGWVSASSRLLELLGLTALKWWTEV